MIVIRGLTAASGVTDAAAAAVIAQGIRAVVRLGFGAVSQRSDSVIPGIYALIGFAVLTAVSV